MKVLALPDWIGLTVIGLGVNLLGFDAFDWHVLALIFVVNMGYSISHTDWKEAVRGPRKKPLA